MKSTFQKLRNIKSMPNPYSNLLGYQSVNVIDPQYSEFMRNFIIDDYYLTIYGTKYKDKTFSVQYNKKYADGRTIWYTEILTLDQINELLSILENLDRVSEKNLTLLNSIRNADIEEQQMKDEEHMMNLIKDVKVTFPAKLGDNY